ncbi:MAG: type II toxin-antitoxin system HipA family toxin [Bacteroidales bacterium]|nr:type II toxin-antitoxin system HipA family toxin [Bacteroidales bacterium]MBR5704306.1 type II toxin-antitoxin system HipA family toxin [Bacteroidales bacterium]
MIDVARVNMFDHLVGTFRWDQRYEVVRFEYDHSFVGLGLEPSPLMMPVREGRIYSFAGLNRDTFMGLPGMLADALPDSYGRALFDQWLSLTGHTSSNPVETLCFLGKRCMGALEFEPAIEMDYNSQQLFEINSLVEVARDALTQKAAFGVNLNDEKKAAIAEILRLGTSAGGQRAKAIIAYNKATGEVRSGQVEAPAGFDYYLIKLDGVSAEAGFRETENYGRLEYSFYQLAKDCGIEMSECMLIEENGRAHFLAKRFDRNNGRKVHMQTLCALAHYDFRLLRGYSYEQAFGVMRALRLPYSAVTELFRRMVFNVVVRNQDDHTKNISFLMGEDGQWRLSPAYDMGYAFNPQGGWTSMHQMSVNGKFDKISRADLLACAAANDIKEADDIIDQICDAASSWPRIAKDCGVPLSMTEDIVKNMQFL